MKWKKMSGVMLIVLAILVILVFQVLNADAKQKPEPTNPVHDMTCLVHKGTPQWYVEPATSAHLDHGDTYCEDPGDPPEYSLRYYIPLIQNECPFPWICTQPSSR